MTTRFATGELAPGIWCRGLSGHAAAMALLLALTVALAADAAKRAHASTSMEAMAPREAGEPIMAIVSIKSQQVTIYDADGWIMRAPVSTGIKGRETPAGVFSVVEKEKDHHSNMYDDAWMPNMHRITWNGLALHGGPLPGHPASHGCIRMPYRFAEKLYGKTRIGMRVIISPDDAAPVEFSHPALFMPNPQAIAAVPGHAEALAKKEADAARKLDAAKRAAAAASREVASLSADMRKLEKLKIRADADLVSADKALAAAKTDQARAWAEELKRQTIVKIEELRTQIEMSAAKSKLDAAAAAKEAVKAAEAQLAAAAKAARDAKLALVPVSVFISRATQKLYVRRGFDSILEAPVTIRDPKSPIGTHVFTAVARNETGLRWTAVTIDHGDDAKDALDRITIPKDVLDRIAPTAMPRSSIIISDEPLHRETNYRTEFVVALNNQPQGGLITRPRTPPLYAARDDGPIGYGFGGGFYRDSQAGSMFRQGGRYWGPYRAW